MYRGWTQTDYQNKHYNINQKDEETYDDRGRDGGTNFILRIKEQETCLTLQEHDDDDDDDDDDYEGPATRLSPASRAGCRFKAALLSDSFCREHFARCVVRNLTTHNAIH